MVLLQKPQVCHSTFKCVSGPMNSTDQRFFPRTPLISDHLRNNGDSRGHSSCGGSACVGSGPTVHSLSSRLFPLARGCAVAWETCKDFTTSPEKVLIHTSTDRERRSSRKYLALRKHLHTGVQAPMSARQPGPSIGTSRLFQVRRFNETPCCNRCSHGDETCC